MRSPLVRVFVVILAAFLIGCEAQQEKKPEVQAPLPPDPKELANTFITKNAINGPIPGPDAVVRPGLRANFMNEVQQFKNMHSNTDHGKEAIRLVATAIDGRIGQMEQAELWDFAVLLIDAYELLTGNKTKFARLREEATIQLKKPRVVVAGIPTMAGQKFAMLKVTIPTSGKTYDWKPRLGEEQYWSTGEGNDTSGLRLKEFIGNDKGVRLVYLETNEEFDVYLTSFRP